MKCNRIARLALVAMTIFSALAIASATIRGSSGNGEGSDAATWLLLGRSKALRLSPEGSPATVRREIVCLNQTVENALPNPDPSLAGSCYDGVYMYLFQVQSPPAHINVFISGLSGFSQASADYGEMICDPENTMELCTNAPGADIPDITATTTKTSVRFEVPGKFPSYPAGTEQEGRGLTFFVITRQAAPLPIGLPSIRIR